MMSSLVIKLDYGKGEATIKTFHQTVEQLQSTLQEVRSIAQDIEGGTLVGSGGQELTRVILEQLCPAISKISEKFQKTAKDLQSAMHDLRQADAESKSKF